MKDMQYNYGLQETGRAERNDLIVPKGNDRAPSVIDENFFEYSHELNQDTWSVEEVPDKQSSSGHDQEGENS